MAKVPVALRLSPEKLAVVDAYAKARGSSRQVVLEAAVDNFLADAAGGVPDLPVVMAPAPKSKPEPSPVFADANGTRQQRLNASMLRARGKR